MSYEDVLKTVTPQRYDLPLCANVACVDIGVLAKMIGRKSTSIKVLEEKGVFPPPNFRSPSTSNKHGVKVMGNRLYTLKYAKQYAEVFIKHVKQGVKITPEVVTMFYNIANAEKQEYFNA
jgi:hypothetical protein